MDAGVARPLHAAFWHRYYLDAVAESSHYIERIVGRMVVDDDDLRKRALLGKGAIDGGTDEGASVISGNDQRDGSRLHRGNS